MHTGGVIPLEAWYCVIVWKSNIFEIFILLLVLSLLPPCRAAKGSILCWKPRLAAPGLASLMALWGGLCEVRCEAQLWWLSAPGKCRPVAGHRVEPVWSLPRGLEEPSAS